MGEMADWCVDITLEQAMATGDFHGCELDETIGPKCSNDVHTHSFKTGRLTAELPKSKLFNTGKSNMYSENEIEKEIQDKNLNAPRLRPEDIDRVIDSVEYTLSDSNVTVCTIKLKNSFTVTGINHGPVSLLNYDADIGQKLSYKKAREQIWPLEGYLLAQTLYESEHYAKKIV